VLDEAKTLYEIAGEGGKVGAVNSANCWHSCTQRRLPVSTAPKSNRTTHTPGPWEVAKKRYLESAGVICVEHPNHDALDVITAGWSESEEEHQANARLVAAAPDLYAALKAFKQAVADGEGLAPCYDMANAAIRKAEGR
jgi:hypothetical protein